MANRKFLLPVFRISKSSRDAFPILIYFITPLEVILVAWASQMFSHLYQKFAKLIGSKSSWAGELISKNTHREIKYLAQQGQTFHIKFLLLCVVY